MQVPAAPPSQPELDIYHVAPSPDEIAPTAIATVATPVLNYQVAKVALDPQSAATRRYLQEHRSDVRDLYVPLGLLTGSFLAIIAWAITQRNSSGVGLELTAAVVIGTTFFKTAIIATVVLALSPRLNVVFGYLGSLILKFSAMVLCDDAAAVWLHAMLRYTGAISPAGRGSLDGLLLVDLGVSAIVLLIFAYFFFGAVSAEAWDLARLLSICIWLLNIFLKFAMAALLSFVVAARKVAPVAVTVTGRPAPATVPFAPLLGTTDEMRALLDVDARVAKMMARPQGAIARLVIGVCGREFRVMQNDTNKFVAMDQPPGKVKVEIDFEKGPPEKAHVHLLYHHFSGRWQEMDAKQISRLRVR